ncbi:MAG: hypothetical protein JKY45_02435 [Emcibacter sp.]|nr:hypothetical protein [Emcibacter sp.]
MKLTIVPLVVILLSCCGGELYQKNYYESPDGRYVVEQIFRNIGLHNFSVEINIGTLEQFESGDQSKIFHETGLFSDIYWVKNDKVIIVLCGSPPQKIENFAYDAAAPEISIRLMTHPEVNREGKPVCGNDQDGMLNGYSNRKWDGSHWIIDGVKVKSIKYK